MNSTLTLRSTKGIEAQFYGSCENLKFYPFVMLNVLFVIVCIYYTGVCVPVELNFIVCITLSRYILRINPELISSNQDTGTNRVTTWQTYFPPSVALT